MKGTARLVVDIVHPQTRRVLLIHFIIFVKQKIAFEDNSYSITPSKLLVSPVLKLYKTNSVPFDFSRGLFSTSTSSCFSFSFLFFFFLLSTSSSSVFQVPFYRRWSFMQPRHPLFRFSGQLKVFTLATLCILPEASSITYNESLGMSFAEVLAIFNSLTF